MRSLLLISVSVLSILAFDPLPICGQFSSIIDDFSNHNERNVNSLGLWRGGTFVHDPKLTDLLVMAQSDWWVEVIAKDGECMDISNKALVLLYFVKQTGPRVIQLYQKSEDCQSDQLTVFYAKIMFYKEKTLLKIPLNLFRGANLTRAHSLVFTSDIIMEKIELVGVWEAYDSLITYPLEWFPPIDDPTPTGLQLTVMPTHDTHTNPVHEAYVESTFAVSSRIIINNDIITPPNQQKHKCFNLRGKTIRVTYTLDVKQPFKTFPVHLHFRPFVCENEYTLDTTANIIFRSGKDQYLDIPASAFRGANLSTVTKIFVCGSVTVHSIVVLDNLSTPDSVPVQSPFYSHELNLVDDFAVQLDSTSAETHRWRCYKLNPQARVDYATSNHFSMDGYAFEITYSSMETVVVSLALLRWHESSTRKRKFGASSSQLPDINTHVMLFAGENRKVRVPIVNFRDVGSDATSALFDGLTIKGHFAIHTVDLVDNVMTLFDDFYPNIAAETVIGNVVPIVDYSAVSNLGIRQMYMGNQLSRNAVLNPGQIDLPSDKDYVNIPFDFSNQTFDSLAGAIRFTYSATTSQNRRLLIRSLNKRDMRVVLTKIMFSSGSNQELVVPFTAFPITHPFSVLRIHGPLSIHKVGLVTTTQNGIVQGLLDGPPKPTIVITRDHLFQDAYKQMSALYPEQFSRSFCVQFFGEQGSDADGLSREFFTLISRSIADPANKLFIASPESNYKLQIDPSSCIHSNCTSVFKFVGRIIGLAYIYSHLLEIEFAPSVLKAIFNQKVDLLDLRELEPDIYQSFENLRRYNSVDDAGLVMSAGYLDLPPTEFEPMGASIPVTTDNFDTFLNYYCDWRVQKLVETQISAMRQGIKDTVPARHLHSMSWQIFSNYISGTSVINVEDWENHTVLDGGYAKQDVTVKAFWSLITQWTNKDRQKLLQFVTGSTRLPSAGFVGFGDQLFTIFKVSDTDMLPSAHTCCNRLDLPPYATSQVLEAKLRYAMEETRFEII